jgi:hypothetical protein
VDVDVPDYPRACRLADVRSHIEPVRTVQAAQDTHAARGKLHHLRAGWRIQFFEVGLMLERHDHQMPAGVRVQVEDDKGPLSAKGDQIFGAVGPGLCLTERTAFRLVVLLDVFHSPG